MPLKHHFALMADYNQWMNDGLYTLCAKVPAHTLTADRGAFFGSILGTFNHVLVGDILWLKRFAQHPDVICLDPVLAYKTPSSLSQQPYTDFQKLWHVRQDLDKHIVNFAAVTTEHVYSENLTYTNMQGERHSKNFGHLVQHFFNHQTHHRGQITTLLNQSGIDSGITDLLARIPETN